MFSTISGPEAQKRWKKLRDKYRKLKVKYNRSCKSRAGYVAPPTWELYPTMTFIDPFLDHMESVESPMKIANTDRATQDDNSNPQYNARVLMTLPPEERECKQECKETIIDRPIVKRRKRNRTYTCPQDTAIVKALGALSAETSQSSKDEDLETLLLKAAACILKKLPDSARLPLVIRVLQLLKDELQKYENQ